MRKIDKIWANRTPKCFKGKHPDWYWVRVSIPLTKKELVKNFGRKCRSYERGCGCCDAWKSWEKNGRVVVTVERANCILDASASDVELLIELYKKLSRSRCKLSDGVRAVMAKVKKEVFFGKAPK